MKYRCGTCMNEFPGEYWAAMHKKFFPTHGVIGFDEEENETVIDAILTPHEEGETLD